MTTDLDARWRWPWNRPRCSARAYRCVRSATRVVDPFSGSWTGYRYCRLHWGMRLGEGGFAVTDYGLQVPPTAADAPPTRTQGDEA